MTVLGKVGLSMALIAGAGVLIVAFTSNPWHIGDQIFCFGMGGALGSIVLQWWRNRNTLSIPANEIGDPNNGTLELTVNVKKRWL